MRSQAEQCIQTLKDPDSYQDACCRESEVWGSIFGDPEREKRIAADQQAASVLQINRNTLSLPGIVKEACPAAERGLSLACGAGRTERMLVASGIVRQFDGIDMSDKALQEARCKATEEGLAISYRCGDLNRISLEKERYDLVVAQNCLHHILELEHLADQILQALRPGGFLWIHDFIGESQFQWTEKRLTIARALLELLPSEMRWDSVNMRRVTIVRPVPGRLISPFEAIRSAEIISVFSQKFELVRRNVWNAVLYLVVPVGTRRAFAGSEYGRNLFENIFALDRALIDAGTLSPLSGQFLLKKG